MTVRTMPMTVRTMPMTVRPMPMTVRPMPATVRPMPATVRPPARPVHKGEFSPRHALYVLIATAQNSKRDASDAAMPRTPGDKGRQPAASPIGLTQRRSASEN
jgi:hypothetical protein